ncbi:MAG: cytochrome c biogenesis protein ResB [Thermogemmatispora sp.]|jgi:cytochrome c biogenesis protein|uniref:Cytochrome c biogenesis protein ResB n=1 Tax=Thermogemmatispora aurantia TaxID=2045279 RepID=A0A5J4KE26_9CHLR|nr:MULTISPECIES: cytochrome c biogenesis protein ResB [Thermogemmatispora]MBE3566512.1 cytochrome c biogenesis protein ResB [Thermogemmatispora sp.]GER85212.1 cytochrome c biogenesis protein ResB [Thermogemmatispora aurantia]
MATLLKQSQRGAASRRARPSSNKKRPAAPRLSPGQRLKKRLTYAMKHPLDALWGWLSSVRTAIFLIVCIIVVCILGIYFPQAPGEVLNDPTAYQAWLQQNALPQYGSLTPIYDWLHFFTIFSSWYFMLLLGVLALSIVVCTLNRAPAIWQNFAHPLIRRSDRFYQNALERASFSHPEAVAWTSAALRRRGYRVRSESDSVDNCEVTYLYANKNTWATLSTFVFHASLVALLLAGMISQWHGFPLNSPARRILPAPIISLSDALAGFSFDQALPTGESAVVYPRGTPHNISFRVNHFTARFDPQTGQPVDYVTDLSVYRDGELVAHSDHLRVNDPLTYDGITFHQSSLVASAVITITDAQGNVLYHDAVILDSSSTLPSGNGVVDYARGIPIGGTNYTMGVFFIHAEGQHLSQIAHPVLLIAIGTPGTSNNEDKALLRLSPGQSGKSVDGQWTIRLDAASDATVLLVTRDAGSPLVWPIAVVLVLSLCITFYFPQRRIWLRIRGDQVEMAALREHFTNIRTDLLGIAREARASAARREQRERAPEEARPSHALSSKQ